MSMRYPGGLIATSPVNARYPSGVWTQAQAAPYQAQNVWTRDQFWPYTTLLLQGDGAVNGAQNNTFLDSSTNNFTITRNGNTTQGAFTPYEQDGYWSNYFDGSGDYLTTPSNTAFAFGTGDFTVEAFVFITATNSQNLRVFTTAGVGSDFAFEINTSLQLAHFNGSTTLTLGGSVPLNQWVHIAWVRSGSTVTGYINGVSIGTATSSANMSNSQTISIGATASYTSGQTAYISNLRVVKGTAVYTSAFTPSTAPLTAITNTSLLTCQSNRFKDNSTNNFTISTSGSPSVQAFQPFPGATTWSASVLGGSGYFDGSGDFLTVAPGAAFAFGTGDFTVETWFYYTGLQAPNTQYLFDARNSGQTNAWAFHANPNANTIVWFNGSADFGPSATVSINQWNHVAYVRSGTTGSMYFNGVRIGTQTDSTNYSVSPTTSYIGARYSLNESILGYMSNARVVKGTAVYSGTTYTVPTAPLTAITNTSLLLNMTNAGIYDNSMMNNLETVGNAQVSTSVVKYGTGSMAFDGSGDIVRVPSSPNLDFGSGNWTIEFWMNTSNVSTRQDILDRRASAIITGWMLSMSIVTAGRLTFYASGPGWPLMTSGTSIVANTWTHIAIVRNGSSFVMYQDGIQVASATSSTAMSDNNFFLQIGNSIDNVYYTGYIDDLRITKGAARYITNFTPPIARLPAQ